LPNTSFDDEWMREKNCRINDKPNLLCEAVQKSPQKQTFSGMKNINLNLITYKYKYYRPEYRLVAQGCYLKYAYTYRY